MQKPQTWRELLGRITDSPQERQRIAAELNVSPVTLMRWVKHESNPRLPVLRNLLAVLPKHRAELQPLIEQEFPDYGLREQDGLLAGELPLIPSEFYARVMYTHSLIPAVLRFSSLCDLVLQQILAHLDTPHLGLAAIVTKCMLPSEGNRVRSLRECVGRGTHPWGEHLEQQAILLGSESLAGYSVIFGHAVTNRQLSEQFSLYPGYRGQWEESAVAAPIMRGSMISGCLLVSSTQPDFFLAEHLTVIQQYAELLSLAFEPHDFYEMTAVELWPMPVAQVQQPYMTSFRQRVVDAMMLATVEGRPLSLIQAEEQVWQDLEKELFRLSIEQAQELD